MVIYLDLTREFNAGRTRAVICSGQACVLHRLAIASKDGDWILREDDEALDHVLRVLEQRGARYRFGAPLDVRWMSGGWSAHFEFKTSELRVRTDFFTRPPRISSADLARMWREQDGRDLPFTDARITALMKQTDREKDWPFVGELARLETDARNALLLSRSPRDLIHLAGQHPALMAQLREQRPALSAIAEGSERLLEELDRERRAAMRADRERLSAYVAAGRAWADAWPAIARATQSTSLLDAHQIVAQEAARLLPTQLDGTASP